MDILFFKRVEEMMENEPFDW